MLGSPSRCQQLHNGNNSSKYSYLSRSKFLTSVWLMKQLRMRRHPKQYRAPQMILYTGLLARMKVGRVKYVFLRPFSLVKTVFRTPEY